ncbi:MAG: urease accessory protein UreD [Rhodobacteraceae bacterium]|nr:urease accessory protein UreD [Paracoccaceae bacterium]
MAKDLAGAAPHQRARGEAVVTLGPGPRGLEGLRQRGCAKAFLPRVHTPCPEVVFLNTAGGLTGGDRLRYGLNLGPGAQVMATTQTAERAYASVGPDPARVEVAMTVGAGALLHWLPQETILFEDAHMDRRTRVDLGPGARLLICETVVLGRTAMGETLHRARLRDRREVWQEGRPVLIDPLKIGPPMLDRRGDPAILGGAVAFGWLALVAPDALDRLGAVRQRIAEAADTVQAAASAWDGKLVLRALAHDGYDLRCCMAQCLSYLAGRDLPRVWTL